MGILSSELEAEARAHTHVLSLRRQSFGAWSDRSLEGAGSRNGCSVPGLGLCEWD